MNSTLKILKIFKYIIFFTFIYSKDSNLIFTIINNFYRKKNIKMYILSRNFQFEHFILNLFRFIINTNIKNKIFST